MNKKNSKNIFSKAKDQLIVATKKRYTNKKGKINVANIAKDIASVARMFNTENKHIDTLSTVQTVSNVIPLVYGIGTVAQGSASNQRTGDSIKIDRIDYILKFNTSAVAPTVDANFRWFLIKYNKTPSTSGTTAFAISEFLNQDANSQYTSISFPNPDTNQNFSILSQGRVLMPVVTIANGSTVRIVEGTINTSFHQDYSGAASTTITENMVFLVFVVDVGNSGVSAVLPQTRMWFVDN